jgi:hypothetical protein
VCPLRICLVAVALLSLSVNAAAAVVFHARDEAIKLAFPDADKVETRDFFLTTEQRTAIEERAKAKLDSDLLTVYVGHRGGSVSGYALLDTHVVRTLPETFMIVLSPDGRVTSTYVLAFYEPTEYMPNERWLEQFKDKREDSDLRIGRGIAAITGSTLTSHAVTAAVRRAVAIHFLLLRSE